MKYYLINIIKKVNKVFTNNWFGKITIKDNKNKIKPLANAILDKFLRKTVMLDLILLARIREIIVKKSDTINYKIIT